jgi:citrate synthase
MIIESKANDLLDELSNKVSKKKIDPCLYEMYGVKRGLRNNNGTGVLVGLTDIGEVRGYFMDDNEKIPVEGSLMYRGINITELVKGFQKEKRFGYEEACYLLLFGELPTINRLIQFNEILGHYRPLPDNFTEDMILKSPSNDIMNKLARTVLALYSQDPNPDDNSIRNVLRQSVDLIAKFPTLVAYGYQAKSHYYGHSSLYLHSPKPELSTAENLLYMIRPDNNYTKTEAEILDLSLVIHAEHGGGNNSAFVTHVVTSTGTDTYSAIAAAIGALKGPRHGGANMKVMDMMADIKEHLSDWNDRVALKEYLLKILRKEAYDNSGLIYGLGHAVYTLSDPRALLLKEKALELAKEKGRLDEFNLYKLVEEVGSEAFQEYKNISFPISANVDFYSGFVYNMLNIPEELYTPIFAVARIVGWCAHRIEEIVSAQKIIRPAYKNVSETKSYIPVKKRKEI